MSGVNIQEARAARAILNDASSAYREEMVAFTDGRISELELNAARRIYNAVWLSYDDGAK